MEHKEMLDIVSGEVYEYIKLYGYINEIFRGTRETGLHIEVFSPFKVKF